MENPSVNYVGQMYALKYRQLHYNTGMCLVLDLCKGNFAVGIFVVTTHMASSSAQPMSRAVFTACICELLPLAGKI